MINSPLFIVLPLFGAAVAGGTAWFLFKGILRATTDDKMFSQLVSSTALTSSVSGMLSDVVGSGELRPGPEAMAAVRPVIEAHLDTYLRVRLKEKMPVIASFIGESTLGKLKDSMIEEVDALLPDVMNSFISASLKDDALTQRIADTLLQRAPSLFAGVALPVLSGLGRRFTFAAFLVGAFAGLLLALLLQLIS